MGKQQSTGTERRTDRIEAFSDAVLAIAITLPVVSLESPTIKAGESLSVAYAALWPGYVSYALSVIVIGVYWAHSHFSGKIIRETDHVFNILSVLFLALVSITPFPTRPFITNLTDSPNNRIAATVYAAVLAAPSIVWLVRWHYAATSDLLDPRLAPEYINDLRHKYILTTATSITSTFICWFIDWRLGIAIAALVILRYLLPPMAPQYKPGQEPEDEIEEADEQ